MNKVYLGDGVYARQSDHGGCLVLTTENGIETTNTIVLDLGVYEALVNYVERLRAEAANHAMTGE